MVHYVFTYANLEYFLLIFARMTAFVSVNPIFGTRNTVPGRVKIGFSLFMSFLLYGLVKERAVSYGTILGYSFAILREVCVGILLACATQMCMGVTVFAGSVVDMMTGLSMVTMMDPMSMESVTITGTIYNYAMLLMLMVSGMYRYLLSAFADSFSLIPIGQAVFHTDRLLKTMLSFMTDYIVIGFRISLPVFVISFIVTMILGILAKVAPQMNMFSVGIQIKILIGVFVMYLSCRMLGGVSTFIFRQIQILMKQFTNGMIA